MTPLRSERNASNATTPLRTERSASNITTSLQTEGNLTMSCDVSLPASFAEMSNMLDICNWLVKQPHILELANQMLAASTNTSSNTNMVINPFSKSANLAETLGEVNIISYV